MPVSGMDTDLGTSQASQLMNQGVDAVQNVITTLDNLMGEIASNWQGPDSTTFHGEWSGAHKSQLMQVHQALLDFHTKFTQQIQQQVDASTH